jgi:hypothetical protein
MLKKSNNRAQVVQQPLNLSNSLAGYNQQIDAQNGYLEQIESFDADSGVETPEYSPILPLQSNNSQQLDIDIVELDSAQNTQLTPTQAGQANSGADIRQQLIDVKNQIAKLKSDLGDKSKGLVGEKNKARDQKQRADKNFARAQTLELQQKANYIVKRYELLETELAAKISQTKSQINDLQQKEKQLEYKMQSRNTPIEIGGNNG